MRILDARINEHKGYANPPSLQLLVEDLGPTEEFRYKYFETPRGTAYYSELNGEVRFFFHTPNNETGFGGSVFNLTMEDGSTRQIRGPWSSRPGIIDSLFGTASVDIDFTDDPSLWQRNIVTTWGHCTRQIAQEAVDKFLPEWSLVEVNDGEINYRPVKKEEVNA